MHPKYLLLIALTGVLMLPACKSVESNRTFYTDTPVAYSFVSEVIDEETIEHSVKFRNVGKEIISFDYTITDDPTVPHIDCLGPNSGLVENLYPGAEVMVKNTRQPSQSVGIVPGALPTRGSKIQVVLGRVTHGKKTSDELARVYKPETIKEKQESALDLDAGSLIGGNG